ncbi:MAG TPA: tRNA (adenosine(37)-N6)-dimethylallyltransferase MiaA [Thermodesulfovibrionia bacterium]|nr:tRNA (adenosine(37)-N6)-dimethylallyltransferase MiaA [Thermodesulfovibrionia bacterium]
MKTDLVIIILGPTGVGKTGVSVKLATRLNTEIISADSMLIYKGMDIATAKPSEQQRQAVRHHLIDIMEPDQEEFSAGMFHQEATAIINQLHRQSKIPLVVGGTGLYIKTLTVGLFEGPKADWFLRQQLAFLENLHGRGFLYGLLKTMDEQSAFSLNQEDIRRIIRALEVRIKTGKTTQQIHSETVAAPYTFIKIGLTRQRQELYRLINERVDSMIQSGLVEETEALLRDRHPGQTAMQAIGYKEISQHLNGKLGFDEAVNLLKQRSRHYAKKQLTWFRKEPQIQWVDITGLYEADTILEKLLEEVAILKTIL